jgi:lysophospholipase L1-like esterase
MKTFRTFALLLFVLCFSSVLLSMNKKNDDIVSKVFNFDSSKKTNKATNIFSAIPYDQNTGYGFDFKTTATFIATGIAIKENFYFSVKVPEGNYQIKVKMNTDSNDSKITIKAESRRLMVNQFFIKKGKSSEVVFNVNIRNIFIDNTSSIKLKDREKTELTWDDKLTLEFLGIATIQEIEIIPIENITTIFLAGDSTVTDQDLEPWASWGQMITQYFDNNVIIANYASSGYALSSFKSSNRLAKINAQIKAGDYLFIEFGHNDEKIKGPENSAWKSYSDLLVEFIQMAKDKGAFPILVTPTQRRSFNTDGFLYETHGDFPEAMRAVSKKKNIPLIDMTKKTTSSYENWGDDESRKAFVHYRANTFPGQTKALEDDTHFNAFGANEIALSVIEGIRELNLPLTKHLIKQSSQYDSNHPNYFSNWTLPMSSRFEVAKPDGN